MFCPAVSSLKIKTGSGRSGDIKRTADVLPAVGLGAQNGFPAKLHMSIVEERRKSEIEMLLEDTGSS